MNTLEQLSFLLMFVPVTYVLGQGIQWVTPNDRNIPPHSWVAAGTKDKSEDIFICVGQRQESVVCGQTYRKIGANNCLISYDDRVWNVKSKNILTLPLWVPHIFDWVGGYTHGMVPPDSIECGDMTYIGRFLNGTEVILGKVDSLNQAFFYADKMTNKERYMKCGYEVLIRKDI
ncbi:hypothetical protein HOLleu_32041 [Holothuria leucospilota]|uniref:DUF3421 domain-containing protein n=1 Tax=Holothuria leucospilota TaxID=206669 RepID=A0A9Q0YTT4_HOLLE|nr:hypothetical protein HOLleu_32041 [Holothuria leucospilota]